MQNRRNYYRILRVQPDASIEVIKDSYRALMQKLRMHPDLGGEEWNASIINQAYSTLRNSAKRAKYDVALLKQHNIVTLSQGHLKIPKIKMDQSKKPTSTTRKNQRNYYRILHVQPDAEEAVISASYCVLKNKVQKANRSTTLLDHAWAVLGDEKKRAAYDKTLQQVRVVKKPSFGPKPRTHQKPKFTQKTYQQASDGSGTGTRVVKASKITGAYGKKVYAEVIKNYCLFCKTPYSRSHHIEDAQQCHVCRSPLFSPQAVFLEQPRRLLERIQQETSVSFYEYWPGHQYTASLLDLSPTGLRFSSQHQMGIGQMIKIEANGFAAVAEVTSRRQVETTMQTGVRFASVLFDRQSGSFFSKAV